MLTEICAEIRNYFEVPNGRHFGRFEIEGGSIAPLDFLKHGQFFRIVGSTFNDGVYRFPAVGLTDETFNGAVWAMAVPPAVVALADKIKAFEDSEQAKPSVYASESFGGYSYTKATNADGSALTWKNVFAADLRKWRKI